MTFAEISSAPFVLLGLVVLFLTLFIMEKKYFHFVHLYWFYRRSYASYLASLLFFLGMSGLLLSLLDLRAKEEKLKVPLPMNRTIILLDTSASMLAEDVRPSRLKKALLMAKHFARKAVGQQISVIAFSEIHKKIVPFTNDLDLIDSRLDSLEDLRNHYGSSALSVALQESIQYFKDVDESSRANILVFTDGEETSEGIKVQIPENIKVAFVGIGTESGAPIPLDGANGIRMGHKTFRGQKVITKLEEKYFKDLVADIKQARYWRANSYSLPTEEIVNFFGTGVTDQGKLNQEMTIRPVLMERIVIPSLILLVLSYFLKYFKTFSSFMILVFFLSFSHAGENLNKLNPQIELKMNQLQEGKLERKEKIKLADELYSEGLKKEGLSLFSENMPSHIDTSIPLEAYFNFGTSLLETGKEEEGLRILHQLSKHLKKGKHADHSKLQELIDKNISSYFSQQQQNQEKNSEKDKNKNDQQNEQNVQNDSSKGQNQPENQKENQNKQSDKDSSKKTDENQDLNDQNDQEKQANKNDKDNKKNQDEKKDQDDNSDRDSKEKASDSLERMSKNKLPAKLKQLLSDDRKLQMQVIENQTRDLNKKYDAESKGW